MALDLRQIFVSVQYLENKLTDFHQNFIYAFILTRSTLGLLHIIFGTFLPELWPMIYSKILFSFNILRTNEMDRISPNFIYAFILTRSTLELLYICTRVMAFDLRQNVCFRSIS